jgi:hypothetical protein
METAFDFKRPVDHFLKCTGIAAIEIGAGGDVTVHKTVEIEPPTNRLSFCCVAGDAKRLAALARRCRGDQTAIAAHLVERADALGISLTPHAVVVDRALTAVDAVNAAFDGLMAAGDMAAINRAFKAARAETPALRYRDYLETCRLRALEAMARQATR